MGVPRTKEQREAAFWNQVDIGKPDQCWLFKGAVNQKNGYGQKWWIDTVTTAHCVAYMLHYNFDSLPPKYEGSRTNVMHTCDVRLCCNPAHLVLGNAKLNQRDKAKKGRHHLITRKTCKHGHAWTKKNTFIPNYPSQRHKDGTPWNVRYCRECLRIREDKRRKRGKS